MRRASSWSLVQLLGLTVLLSGFVVAMRGVLSSRTTPQQGPLEARHGGSSSPHFHILDLRRVLPLAMHSHNDEAQDEPLVTALQAGACSIEVDFYCIGGNLIVGHDWDMVEQNRSLEEMYIRPLVQQVVEGHKLWQQGEGPGLAHTGRHEQPSGMRQQGAGGMPPERLQLYPAGAFLRACNQPMLLLDYKYTESLPKPGEAPEPLPQLDTPEQAHSAVTQVLKRYADQYPGLFSKFSLKAALGPSEPGALTVVMSGARPSPEFVIQNGDWLVALDGRLDVLSDNGLEKGKDHLPPSVMPMISCDMLNSTGAALPNATDPLNLTEQELKDLLSIIGRVHRQGRQFRLWGTPDKPVMWRRLLDWGVDLITTDTPKELHAWVHAQLDAGRGAA